MQAIDAQSQPFAARDCLMDLPLQQVLVRPSRGKVAIAFERRDGE
jgi:hypothetical protein